MKHLLVLVLHLLVCCAYTFRIRSRASTATASRSTNRHTVTQLEAWSIDASTWPIIDFGPCEMKFGQAPLCLEMLFSHKASASSVGAFGNVGIVKLEHMEDAAFLKLLERRGAEVAKLLGIEVNGDTGVALEKYHDWFGGFAARLPTTISSKRVFMKVMTGIPSGMYREVYWGILTHIDQNLRASLHIADCLAFGVIGRQIVMFFKEEAVMHVDAGEKVQSDIGGLTRSLDGRSKLAAALGLASPSTLNGTQEAQREWAEKVVASIGAQAEEGLEDFKRSCLHHHDIKGNNLIISSDGRVKFIDFGLSSNSCLEHCNDQAHQDFRQDHCDLETKLKTLLPKQFVKGASEVTAATSARDRESGDDESRLAGTLLSFKAILSCRFKSGIHEVTLGKGFHGLEESDMLEILTRMHGEEFANENMKMLRENGEI